MSGLDTRWAKFIDILIEVGVGVYAGHGVTAAKWQPSTPDANWQPDPVDAAWGAGSGGPATDPDSIVWQDVTCDTFQLRTFTGSDRWGETFDVGTARFSLRNESGHYSTQLDHPHAAVRLRVGGRVRISARAAGAATWERLFYGQIIEIDEEAYPDGADQVEVSVADWFSYLAAVDSARYSPHGASTAAERLTTWLNLIEWPATMSTIEGGATDLIATPSDHTGPLLDQLQLVAESDGGYLYCDAAGKIHYRARDWLATDPRATTVQATWWLSRKTPPPSHGAPGTPTVTVLSYIYQHETTLLGNIAMHRLVTADDRPGELFIQAEPFPAGGSDQSAFLATLKAGDQVTVSDVTYTLTGPAAVYTPFAHKAYHMPVTPAGGATDISGARDVTFTVYPPPTPGPPTVCPSTVGFDYTLDRVTNRVHLATEGQHAGVTHQDDPSISAHGFRDLSLTGLLTKNSADLDALAAVYLARLATARRRVTGSTLTIKTLPDAVYATGVLLGDRVRFHYEQPGSGWSADTDAHVFGIEWLVDLEYCDLIVHTDDVIGATP